MSKELPPPITKNSSRAAMWREIDAMQDEIDSQQQKIREWKAIAEKAKLERDAAAGELEIASYQLSMIRGVLAKSFSVRRDK